MSMPGDYFLIDDGTGTGQVVAVGSDGAVVARIDVDGMSASNAEALASGSCGQTPLPDDSTPGNCLYVGDIGDNSAGGSIPYRSSKAAVNMVMRSAAIDLKPRGIIAVVINPGWVKTDMGGADAPLTAAQSVGAMKHLIGSLGPAQSGKFFNYDGREYPW